MVTLQDIYLIISTLLGIIGGIPQIAKWGAKPRLRIIDAEVQKKENARYLLHLNVLNEAKWFKRVMKYLTRDATNVAVTMFVLDKNNDEWIGIHGQSVITHLLVGANKTKDFDFARDFKKEQNPYL